METIGVTAASRGKLSRIVRAAHRDGEPTLITVDGEPAAYVVPADLIEEMHKAGLAPAMTLWLASALIDTTKLDHS